MSPSRRQLLRDGREIPLIPRYLDLLLLLVERRNEAVARAEILDRVWTDVVVSDGALSQAVRSLRRALGDDPREPRFIRTLSRHGYRFIFEGVVEESDDRPVNEEAGAPLTGASHSALPPPSPTPNADAGPIDPFEEAIGRLLDSRDSPENGDDARDAAETLHALGTERALSRISGAPVAARALAILRDARWEVPGAGPVPLFGRPGGLRAAAILSGIRLRRAARLAGNRWAAASAGGAAAGAAAGLVGGVALRFCPESSAPTTAIVAIALVAAIIGSVGAAGVGAGLAAAEALVRSFRTTALVVLGACGGGLVGAAAHQLGAWTIEGVFGRDLSPVGGGFEGIVLGGAAGLGYALATRGHAGGGMAAPRGADRLRTAAVTGLACAAGGVLLTWMGSNLGGVSLDLMARTFQGSHVGLAPLARIFGEPDLGPVTRTVLGAYEGFFFGFGLSYGLTHRPR